MSGLANFYLDAGNGIVISGGRNTRRYSVGEEFNLTEYEETIISESKVWVGLTLAAAETQANLNEQPVLANGERDTAATFSWSYREDQRVVGSYVLQRDYEKKLVNAVSFAATPVLNEAPILSAAGRTSIGNFTDSGFFPGDLTITRRQSGATLFYRVLVAQRIGSNFGSLFGASFQSVAYTSTTASSVTVSINATETESNMIRTANSSSGSYGTWRRVVRVDAYEQVTQTNTPTGEPVTVTSPVITRYYHSAALSVAIPSITFSPNSPHTSFPLERFGPSEQFTLSGGFPTVTVSSSSGTIQLRAAFSTGFYRNVGPTSNLPGSRSTPYPAFQSGSTVTISSYPPAPTAFDATGWMSGGFGFFGLVVGIQARSVVSSSAGEFVSDIAERFYRSNITIV